MSGELLNLASDRGYHLSDTKFQDEILARGSADFCVPHTDENEPGRNLTLNEKTLLYCYRYFRMHYESSYKVFEVLFGNCESFSTPLCLVDFGCGPATSGIALRDFIQSEDFHYIGVDRSAEMLKKAKELIEFCGTTSTHFCENFYELPGVVEKYSSTVAILNFSFFLSPQTFQGNFSELSEVVKEVVQKFQNAHTYLVYQNPGSDNFHYNWYNLKEEMKDFSSVEKTPKLIYYGRPKPVYCDILSRSKSL